MRREGSATVIIPERDEGVLEARESRFSEAFERGPIAMSLLAADGRIIEVNQALCAMLGSAREELIGRFALDITHPEDRDAAALHARELVQGNAASDQRETRYLTKSEGVRRVNVLSSLVRNEEGVLVHLICAIHDITERERAERANENRAKQQAAVAMLGQLALSKVEILDLMDHAVSLIAETLRVDHATIAEALPDGESVRMLATSGLKRQGENDVILKGVGGPNTLTGYTLLSSEPVIVVDYNTETRFNKPALADYLGLTSAVSVIIGEKDRQFGVLSGHTKNQQEFTVDDINFVQAVANVLAQAIERVRAEEEVRRREMQFRSLIENATDVITVLNEDGSIRFLSPSNQRLLGYANEELIGKNEFDLIHADDLPAMNEAMRRAFENREAASAVEYRARHKDGSWRVVEAFSKRLPDELGAPGLVINSRDITERKRGEQELAKARDEALESSRLKSSFLANMSHEIRTPVNTILGYSDLLADYFAQTGNSSVQSYLDAIARGGQRLLRTIQDILDFSRIEAGAFELRRERLRLAPLIERQLVDLRPLAVKKGLSFSLTIEAPEAEVDFDEYCLSNALMNLLQNAIKFTDEGGVTVRLHREHYRDLCIEVADTGIGIDSSYLTKLFVPFSQEQSGYTRRFEGSGLGLALVDKYLTLNGARLSVKSEKGAGSKFTIHLAGDPKLAFSRQAPAAKEATPGQIVASSVGPRPGVLIVEDDPDTQALMKSALDSQYEVLLASNGVEARRQLEASPVSIILMDLSLGTTEDGLAITRDLRREERWRSTPIIATTAHAFAEDRDKALAAGCNLYLSKPVNSKDLLSAIEGLLPPSG